MQLSHCNSQKAISRALRAKAGRIRPVTLCPIANVQSCRLHRAVEFDGSHGRTRINDMLKCCDTDVWSEEDHDAVLGLLSPLVRGMSASYCAVCYTDRSLRTALTPWDQYSSFEPQHERMKLTRHIAICATFEPLGWPSGLWKRRDRDVRCKSCRFERAIVWAGRSLHS